MTTRVLPPDEWHKLAGTEAEQAWPHLTASSQVLVVEHEDQIVGCWVLMPVLHVECFYIAPEHRKRASVGRRLLAGMARLVRLAGGSRVWTAAMSDDVRGLLDHIGATKVPGDHYVFSLGSH